MGNLWNQIFSGRFTLVLLCALVLGVVFVGFSFYGSSKDELPLGVVPMTTAVAPGLPVIDQVIVKETEFALFALG